MHITVLGASGNVGKLVVGYLLAEGHHVTALVHSSNPFQAHKNLLVVQGDVHNPSDLEKALKGADVVISTLGSWGTPTKDILGTAMRSLIPAMQQQGVHRIISLTGSAAAAPDDKPRLIDRINRLMLSIVGQKILVDGEDHIRQLAASNLAWTVVRSPVMRDVASTSYRLNLSTPSPFATIPRQAVARALVDQIESKEFLGQAPHIHSL